MFQLRKKAILDPPWTDWLGIAMQTVSALILTNVLIVLILGAISAIAVNLGADKADQKYIEDHTMLLRAELIFFWCTVPLVYVVAVVTETFCLWDDRLRPMYVVAAGIIGINVWIMQMTLWGPCVLAPDNDGLDRPGYCPYFFRGSRVSLNDVQTVGEPRMAFYSVPTLLILYIAYLTLGAVGMHREKKKPKRVQSFELSKSNTYSSQLSDTESLPFRDSWTNRDSPPGDTRDTDSITSPKTRKKYKGEAEDSESLNPLTEEPAIAVMLTTPHGTTEEQDPFDDDRLSRLGFKAH